MPSGNPVRIPVSLDTEEVGRQLAILKGGFTSAAGGFKSAMSAVYQGITREFRTRTEETVQGVLGAAGTLMQRRFGIAGLTDSSQSKINATQNVAGMLGAGALGMSDAQIKSLIKTMAEYGPGGRRDIQGQRKVREAGAEIITEDTQGIIDTGKSVMISRIADAVASGIGQGFDSLMNKTLGRFSPSSGGR